MRLKHRCMHAHPGICTRASTSRPAQIPMSVSCMVLRFFCTVCMWLVLTMSSKNNSCGDQAGRRPPRQARTENKVRPMHRHAHRGCNIQKCTHTHTRMLTITLTLAQAHAVFCATRTVAIETARTVSLEKFFFLSGFFRMMRFTRAAGNAAL